MQQLRGAQRGDTIIEVILALAIFGMISVSMFTIMQRASSSAYDSLERTTVRQLMNRQAEYLTYLRDDYQNALNNDTPVVIASPGYVWRQDIMSTTGGLATEPTLNSCSINPGAFYVKRNSATGRFTSELGITTTDGMPSEGSGMWVYKVLPPGYDTGALKVKYIDFYIVSCWKSLTNQDQSLSSILRLYIPEVATPVPTPSYGTVPCAQRGPNLLTNGDFSAGIGNASVVNPALYGFNTKLPNRGPNVFPDDEGTQGTNADTIGWAGGISAQTGPKTLNGGYVEIKNFGGDPGTNPAVPASTYSLYSNPNQEVTEPKPTDHGDTTYTGALWSVTLSGLTPGATYDFSGYFANVLTDLWYSTNASMGVTVYDPVIEFSVDGTIIRPAEMMLQSQSAWKRITLTFTAGPTGSALFEIRDWSGGREGDDFAMTRLGVYRCIP